MTKYKPVELSFYWEIIANLHYKKTHYDGSALITMNAGMEFMDKCLNQDKYYVVEEPTCVSFAADEVSRLRSPTPVGGPMLQRSVLCVIIASFIF